MNNQFILLLLFLLPLVGFAQKDDSVSLEITEKGRSPKTLWLPWTFKGPPSIGDSTTLVKRVDALLQENGVECPPARVKLSENVWRCGNGKLIRTKDTRLAGLLGKAWD